jgi:hypothetical protein
VDPWFRNAAVEHLLESLHPSSSVFSLKQLVNRWTDFDEIWYWRILQKIVEAFKFSFDKTVLMTICCLAYFYITFALVIVVSFITMVAWAARILYDDVITQTPCLYRSHWLCTRLEVTGTIYKDQSEHVGIVTLYTVSELLELLSLW